VRLIDLGLERAQARGRPERIGSSTMGPVPGAIRIGSPIASSGTMMSLNTIAASSAMRRSGCSVISTTTSGCLHVSRMSRSPRAARYSGR
jgi:hypothetical protein